ncbi:MAG: response regulator [Proteobacteria bacterium]|nr:MAG: response regulator [Pseudomonadota bacterium]
MNSPIAREAFERKLDERARADGRKLDVRARGRHDVIRSPKMVLIDDDPSYTAIIARCAEREGIELDTFNSLSELGFVSLLRNYDVAIIDYDLGTLNGVEIAEYMSSLLDDMPMVLISASDRSDEISEAPCCVRAFINKSAGFNKILETARLCITAKAS